jgi:hypothetical protein
MVLFRRLMLQTAVVAAGLAILLAVTPPVSADDKPTQQDRNAARANILRQQARENAERRLDYPYAPVTHGPVADDYFALGQQIQRLGVLIQAWQNAAATGAGMARPVPGLPAEGLPTREAVAAVYGPEGPTEKSVRLLLEYRLMLAGNPRLSVGKVTDQGEGILGQVVTREGSVVDEFRVDKKTGGWTPVREQTKK